MAKITYKIDLSVTDGELEQIREELREEPGAAMLTEENITAYITATPTFRRIMNRLYAQMVKTDEENKKAAEAEEESK